MERVRVPDWKVGWEVSLILEALRKCYPLAALDNLVSIYDKWYNLHKSTITVDQASIALTRLWRHASRFGGAAPQQIRKGLHSLP